MEPSTGDAQQADFSNSRRDVQPLRKSSRRWRARRSTARFVSTHCLRYVMQTPHLQLCGCKRMFGPRVILRYIQHYVADPASAIAPAPTSRVLGQVRLRQLDALRGIAALFVVFNHYALTVPESVRQLSGFPNGLLDAAAWLTPWPWLRVTPLRLVVDGEAAVDVFFVLSGFVLALPVTLSRQPEFWPFLLKRACRVYLPFVVVILLFAALYAHVPMSPAQGASRWLNANVPVPGSYSVMAHLLMTGHYSDMVLDPPMWTLVHEMRMAVIFPPLFLAIRRIGAARTLGACVLVSIVASFGLSDSYSGSWQATLHFLWMFAAGSTIAYHRTFLLGLLVPTRPALIAVLWICAVLLLVTPFNRVWSDFLIGCGACLLIILCLPESWASRQLSASVPIWLGKVSYSLYLIHVPILVLALSGHIVSSLVAFLVTLPLAEFTYRCVKSPAHRLGILLSRMAGRGRTDTARRVRGRWRTDRLPDHATGDAIAGSVQPMGGSGDGAAMRDGAEDAGGAAA